MLLQFVQTKLFLAKSFIFSLVFSQAQFIYDMIYLLLQLGCHPVAEVQYTFTQKHYIERYKTNNI